MVAEAVSSRGIWVLPTLFSVGITICSHPPQHQLTYFDNAFAEIGSFQHDVESEMLCSLTAPTKIPYFNAPIYLQNKTQIGKVDEILGPINEVYFTVKMEQGMLASSFKKEDKVYISGEKLLPIERFLPKPKVAGGKGEWSLPVGTCRGLLTNGPFVPIKLLPILQSRVSRTCVVEYD